MTLTPELEAAIRAHAESTYPKESCGLITVVRGKARYVPCRNDADDPEEHFILNPEDYAAAEDAGTVLAIVHSHPNLPPTPSQADLVSIERSQLPWVIVNWPTGNMRTYEPTGYVAPLEGRTYSYGVLDCYTLVQDYYKRTLNIELPHFDTDFGWWIKGEDLYVDNFAAQGFVRILDEEPKVHDVLLMRIATPVSAHSAIFIGDTRILHHQHTRLSTVDIYGGWLRKVTTHVLRHRSQLP
jgi:proteasome lid subunit RPN8/RPN11